MPAPPLCAGPLCQVCQVRRDVEENRPLDGQEQKTQRLRSPQGCPGGAVGKAGQASDSSAHLTPPRAVSSMLCTWLHHYPEHFHQPPEFPRLKLLLAYIELSMPGSDLEQQAHLLLAQLEHLEPPEAEGDGEGDSGWVMEVSGEGKGRSHTESRASRSWNWARSNEEAQITVPLDCSV